LPGQAAVALGIALVHAALGLYVVFRCRFGSDALTRFFIVYLLLTTLWDINLAVSVADDVPASLPGLNWSQLLPYGLIVLGLLYWAFARVFLQRARKASWGWLVGLVGLVLLVSLDARWFTLPDKAFAWSGGRLDAENANLVLGAAWWGLFMGLTLFTAQVRQFRTQSPAHRNRIQYLIIATVLVSAGYGAYLSLPEPYWVAGVIVTWPGSVLLTYIVTRENLLDLGTGARLMIRAMVIAMVTITVYIVGIYLVQIFLGTFLASTFLSRLLDPVLLVATVTAVLLAIVHTPIRRLSRRLTNRVLFAQSYDYQAAVRDYGRAINSILYLDELASVTMAHIKRTLGLDEGVLFILDSESIEQFHFRTLPPPVTTDRFPATLQLTKHTPITHHLVRDGQPLAQYTMDISSQFKNVPKQDRVALKELNLEWFSPILKKKQLIGIFALGPKRSKQRYSARDMRLLATLADQAILALENASLVDQLQRNLEETTRMKKLMDNVFDSMDNGVLTTDMVGRITLFNKAAESILAQSLDNCIGVPYANVLPTLANTAFPSLVSNVLNREDRYTDYEIVSELPNRGKVNLNMNLAPLKDAQNQTQGVTVVMDDLTETKRLRAVQEMFRRYVSPAVVDRLPANPSELRLGGQRQEVTIFFADIRGFTEFSEEMAPEELVDTLNEYLSIAANSILMYEGTLDKFMGDAVMGIFNAPLEQADHTLRAVRAALAMQQTIADYHRNIGQARRLSFGIGLHVGEAVVGNVGTSVRMDYTAIGDTVNLAKRIQENTPAGKALMSKAVYQRIKGSIKTTLYEEMHVKGRKQPVVTYELLA
jgi:PAS domain S-box-containing protein